MDIPIKVDRSEGGEGAYFSGVVQCGSVWVCPVCAHRIARQRQRHVVQAAEAHLEAGGSLVLLTLTVPHKFYDDCRSLLRGVQRSWRALTSGRNWKEIRRDMLTPVRALETTHGRHGWHPHLHVMLFVSQGADLGALRSVIFDRWMMQAKRVGAGDVSADALDWQECSSAGEAAMYVLKGAAYELTHGHLKRSKGGRGPFQILDDWGATGYDRDAALFREYAAAFKGARHVTGLKAVCDHYDIPYGTDDDLAQNEPEAEAVAYISPAGFRWVMDNDHEAEVLTAAIQLGWLGVFIFMGKHGWQSSVRRPPVGSAYAMARAPPD